MSKGKKASNIFMYGLMGMLILGLTGFGISNFGGSATSVGSVGDEEISAEEYFRALSQAVRAAEAQGVTDISLATMDALGIPVQVRGQLAGTKAMDGEAARMKLSVGDDEVARMITASSAFQGITGGFDREGYDYFLEQNNWSVSDFEETIRKEATRNILQASVAAGVAPPEGYVDVLAQWFGERRSFRWVRFDAASMGDDLPAPTDEEITGYYEANEADFTLPQMKRITYAWLTPDMIAATVEVSEDELRAAYAERMDQYLMPERRLVERLVFGSAEEAVEAKQKIDSGETDFETLVADRELALADIDLGDVTESELGGAGTAVFGLTEPGVVGPYPSDLGPALFRMNAILSAQETSFDEAREALQAEFGREKASRVIEDMINDLDDRLAGGATVEDLASETDMELGTLDHAPGVQHALSDFETFRAAAETLTEKDFPEILELDGGGIFAMRLDEVLEPRLQALEEVRDDVIAGLQEKRRLDLARETAGEARAQLDVGGSLGQNGAVVESATKVTRTGFLQSGDPILAEAVFGLEEGESQLVDLPGAVVLVQLDEVLPPDAEDSQIAIFRSAVAQQSAQELANDIFTYYARALTADAGIRFNDAALNAVHTQLFR
ncbi:peptidyl-prolyl cis-trans isomerase D [Aliiruegeria haliotis]|uniref:Peptidyl-prolyl cis-trans isomerase D n=1 Tax=Aliiruegeria haliotis TaxID=1280846 RepID=A0A2T0RZJ7_9RHOB|nr:peptidyl-prolyl cis-trans isomerase [Aliiruegeria haliotis]PRY26599.1 peptidyl-prolyl cis-trans isomerase D [Aliiruegeria haliotis]